MPEEPEVKDDRVEDKEEGGDEEVSGSDIFLDSSLILTMVPHRKRLQP